MDFGFENQHEVTKGGTTLVWGTADGQPILAKSAGYFYNRLDVIAGMAKPISELKSYSPESMGYVVCFSTNKESDVYNSNIVILIPEASFFTLNSDWLAYHSIDSFISTKWLVDKNMMDVYAHVFVSYVPARTSIIPVMWLVTDVEEVDAQFGIENPYGVELYNNTKEALPAVDLDVQEDIRYAVVEYFNSDTVVKAVFNRNHSAFNGSAPRDIIMKPVLASFAENDNAFFSGDVDEISVPEQGDVSLNKTGCEFMNPPVDGPTDIEKPNGFDAAMNVMSLN